MPEINWKIDLGHMITLAVLLAGMFVIWGETSAKMEESVRATAEIKQDVKEIRSQVTEVQIEQARTRAEIEEKTRARDR